MVSVGGSTDPKMEGSLSAHCSELRALWRSHPLHPTFRILGFKSPCVFWHLHRYSWGSGPGILPLLPQALLAQKLQLLVSQEAVLACVTRV